MQKHLLQPSKFLSFKRRDQKKHIGSKIISFNKDPLEQLVYKFRDDRKVETYYQILTYFNKYKKLVNRYLFDGFERDENELTKRLYLGLRIYEKFRWKLRDPFGFRTIIDKDDINQIIDILVLRCLTKYNHYKNKSNFRLYAYIYIIWKIGSICVKHSNRSIEALDLSEYNVYYTEEIDDLDLKEFSIEDGIEYYDYLHKNNVSGLMHDKNKIIQYVRWKDVERLVKAYGKWEDITYNTSIE